jgi:hypothetical protein
MTRFLIWIRIELSPFDRLAAAQKRSSSSSISAEKLRKVAKIEAGWESRQVEPIPTGSRRTDEPRRLLSISQFPAPWELPRN